MQINTPTTDLSKPRTIVVHENSEFAPRRFVDREDYERLFRCSPEAMLLFDPFTDCVIDASDASERLLRRPLPLIVGMPISELHQGQLPHLIVFTQEVLECGHASTDRLELLFSDGSSQAVHYQARRIFLEERSLVLATITDLRALKREHALIEAEHYMRRGIGGWRDVEHFFRDLERENRLILSAAGEGIYGVNNEGITTFVNPAAERMLGWRGDEMVGRNMHELVHHSHADGHHYHEDDCPIYAAFQDGVIHRVDDEVFWRKDGKALPVAYTSTPIYDRGALIGAVVVFRDISRQKKAEEQLHAALDEVNQLRQRLELENAYLQEEILSERALFGIVGQSAPMRRIIQQVELVAPTNATVLIAGESGTGKELIAHGIHRASDRAQRPMIRVNCAAIPSELFESEFFGHIKGAFTGATRDRVGRFELADGGTLFLDEVGEIPLALQGKLLRVLQDGEVQRVGEATARQVDVRVIAATNRDLEEAVRQGKFRQDLYFRLNVFPIHSIPLRDRPEDIAPLAMEFIQRARQRSRKPEVKLTQGDIRQLMTYSWPGNVRELENVIERAVILSRNGRLKFELHEPSSSRSTPFKPSEATYPTAIETEAERRQRERGNIEAALAACGGRVFGEEGAASLLGIPPTTLASRIKKLGINRERWASTA